MAAINHTANKLTMAAERPRRSPFWLTYVVLGVLWLGTVSLSIRVDDSTTANRFNLSLLQLHAIQLALALPGLLIFMAILFAALSLWRYARAIGHSDESLGFRFVAYSIFTLLTGMVVGDYLGNIRQLAAQHAADPQRVKTIFVIITNHVSVAFALLTYGLLLRGAWLLLRSIGRRLDMAKKLVPTVAGFAALTATYLWLIHDNAASQMSTDPDITPTFGLPYWLVILTVVLPYVAAWFMGVLALMGMHQYHLQTTGIVYRLVFRKLVVGMTLFISLTILLQLLTQLSSLYATHNLSGILGIVVVIYIVLTYAFMLIAQGARKLHTIEKSY